MDRDSKPSRSLKVKMPVTFLAPPTSPTATTRLCSNLGMSLCGLIMLSCLGPDAARAAPAEATAQLIDLPGRSTPVSAHGGWVAWSRYDSTRRDYRLVFRKFGAGRGPRSIKRAPIAASEDPFDVSVGPGPDGRATAVYSRCRRGDCDIYAYRLGAGRERLLSSLSTEADERLPTMWRRNVGFVRTDPRRGDEVRVGSLQRRITRVVGGGTRNTDEDVPASITGLALVGTRVAFTATTGPTASQCPVLGKVASDLTEVWTGSILMRPARRIARGCTGDTRFDFGNPAVEGAGVGYTFRPCCQQTLVSFTQGNRHVSETLLPTGALNYVDGDESWTYWMHDAQGQQVRLMRGRLPSRAGA